MPRKRGKGWHATKKEDPRRGAVALKGVEARRLKRVKPKKERTTIVLKNRASFEGHLYRVYAREGSTVRTIFPRAERHPKFASAPFGKKFRVRWKGKEYEAVKEARWQENGVRVPCLV